MLIDSTRAGRMEIAQRDTFRRVYHDNGTYTMPVIPENRLRVRRQPYFVNMEITGSATEKGGKPKFPLLKHFRNTLIPKLDNAVAEMSTKMNRRIVLRYQHDNASPHIEQNFIQFMQTKFPKVVG